MGTESIPQRMKAANERTLDASFSWRYAPQVAMIHATDTKQKIPNITVPNIMRPGYFSDDSKDAVSGSLIILYIKLNKPFCVMPVTYS